MKGRPRNTGSTLIETMIALAVMAMTAAILSSFLGGYGQALTSSSDINAALQRAADRRAFRSLLEFSFPELGPGASERAPFSGSQMALQFGAYDTVSEDLVKVTLTIDPRNGISALVMGVGDFNLGMSRELILSNGPIRAELTYLGGEVIRVRPVWSDRWQNDAQLPRLVRLTIGGEGADVPLLSIWPGKTMIQREMSLSSALPP